MKIHLTTLTTLGYFLLAGCDPNGGQPNTGHQLSISDSLETNQSRDFVITWTLDAPTVARAIEDRIDDPQLKYSIDSGPWQSKRMTIMRITDSKIRLEGRVDQAKLVGHKQIQCYLEYTFDNNREGQTKRKDPRTIEIKEDNKSEQATPRKPSD